VLKVFEFWLQHGRNEPATRKVFDDVEIIGEADNGVLALEIITADQPDFS
jgi:hypothetical protein